MKQCIFFLAILLNFGASFRLAAQPAMQGFPPRPQGSMQAQGQPPGLSGGGLHTHNVESASSPDGLNWTRDGGVRVASVSVPAAVNDGDRRVLLYFVKPPQRPGQPETVASAESTDGMNFTHQPDFRIEGLSAMKAVDPSILRDENGTFRLYYLASDHRGDPASGVNPHRINLALSADGVRFKEWGTAFQYDNLVDPDVFFHRQQWFMYVFGKGGTQIATSNDGFRFTHHSIMSPPGWGTTAPVKLPDGRLRLYAFDQRTPQQNSVHSFISTDGIRWSEEAGERLLARPGEQITDPFVITWRGGYKMYFKTSPTLGRRMGR